MHVAKNDVATHVSYMDYVATVASVLIYSYGPVVHIVSLTITCVCLWLLNIAVIGSCIGICMVIVMSLAGLVLIIQTPSS